jgi:hypothetical protein
MQGRVLVFEHDVLHSGELVTAGVKYTVRTDVEYGPPSTWAWLQESCGLGGSPAQTFARLRKAALALLACLLLVVAMAAVVQCPGGSKRD